MKIGVFTAQTKRIRQCERPVQVLQLLYLNQNAGFDFAGALANSTIRVWNNIGPIVPPTKLKDLAVLNGDEYSVQMGYDSLHQKISLILSFEVCDEGSINKTVYVELDNQSDCDVELSAVDVYQQTAVKMRMYNTMNMLSPSSLPKHSICIVPFASILQLQKNNDVMSTSEILTHSDYILKNGTLKELHPVVVTSENAVQNNPVYQALANGYSMGNAKYNEGSVIIVTGEDDFTLYPVEAGCPVQYCQKQLTEIAQQVQSALVVAGQANNVDSQEFAAAVAAVGKEAARQGLEPSQTQIIANRVVPNLPSVKLASLARVTNFNLSSEKEKVKGIAKVL